MPVRLILLLLFLTLTGHSQFLNKAYYLLDSLDPSTINKSDLDILKAQLKIYHETKEDTVKYIAISQIVETTFDEKIWTRYNELNYAFVKLKQKESTGVLYNFYRAGEALALNNRGYYFFNYTDRIDSSLYYYELGLKINEELQKYDALIVSYSNIANVYQNKGDLIKALELYSKALSYDSKVEDKASLLAPMNNISNIYLYVGDTAQSLVTLKKCFALTNQSGDKNMKAHILHNIGLLYRNKNIHESISYVTKAYHLRKDIGDKKGTAQSLIALSSLNRLINNLQLCEINLKDAEAILEDLNIPTLNGLLQREWAEFYLTKKDREKAIMYYTQSIESFKEVNAVNELYESVKLIIIEFGQDKRYAQKKLAYYELLDGLNKTLNKTTVQKLALRQEYDNQLKIQDAEFKAQQQVKDEKNRSEKRKQRLVLIAITIILLVSIIFSYFIFKALKINKEKTKVIDQQKTIVESQKHLVEEKQKEIIDSINYAKRIQNSFLPSETEFNEAFPGSFIIYQPKDIVSGDFYWMIDSNNYTTVQRNFRSVAVADCTGHGVPGAILSMLGSSILNQAILDKEVMSSADLLDFLNSELKKNLKSKSTEIIRDGMDISCCIIFNDTLKMQFSGANNPCWILRDKEIIELKPDKQAVTAALEEYSKPFKLTEFQLQKNDQLFLFTDGYADQFGGPKGKKYKYAQLKSVIIESAELTPVQQKSHLIQSFNNWKGSLDQVDDVCIIGIRL